MTDTTCYYQALVQVDKRLSDNAERVETHLCICTFNRQVSGWKDMEGDAVRFSFEPGDTTAVRGCRWENGSLIFLVQYSGVTLHIDASSFEDNEISMQFFNSNTNGLLSCREYYQSTKRAHDPSGSDPGSKRVCRGVSPGGAPLKPSTPPMASQDDPVINVLDECWRNQGIHSMTFRNDLGIIGPILGRKLNVCEGQKEVITGCRVRDGKFQLGFNHVSGTYYVPLEQVELDDVISGLLGVSRDSPGSSSGQQTKH